MLSYIQYYALFILTYMSTYLHQVQVYRHIKRKHENVEMLPVVLLWKLKKKNFGLDNKAHFKCNILRGVQNIQFDLIQFFQLTIELD